MISILAVAIVFGGEGLASLDGGGRTDLFLGSALTSGEKVTSFATFWRFLDVAARDEAVGVSNENGRVSYVMRWQGYIGGGG